MKTLHEIILETVDKPRSEDEQRFIDKHVVDKKDHPEAEESQFTSKAKKAKRKADYDEGEDKEVSESRFVRFSDFVSSLEESAILIEAIKAGKMKLKDGSSVVLSKEEADAVEGLFRSLNSSNKKKMEERMTKNKKGFDEIVRFAKEAM